MAATVFYVIQCSLNPVNQTLLYFQYYYSGIFQYMQEKNSPHNKIEEKNYGKLCALMGDDEEKRDFNVCADK